MLVTACDRQKLERYDTFGFCRILKVAFEEAFTSSTIRSSFRRAGMFPWNPERLISVPRPTSSENVSTVIGRDDLLKLLEKLWSRRETMLLGKDAAYYIMDIWTLRTVQYSQS